MTAGMHPWHPTGHGARFAHGQEPLRMLLPSRYIIGSCSKVPGKVQTAPGNARSTLADGKVPPIVPANPGSPIATHLIHSPPGSSRTMAAIFGIDLRLDGKKIQFTESANVRFPPRRALCFAVLALFPRHLHYPDGRVRARRPDGNSAMYCSCFQQGLWPKSPLSMYLRNSRDLIVGQNLISSFVPSDPNPSEEFSLNLGLGRR